MTVQRDPDSARAGFNGTADEILDTGSKHMKLSKRQLQLNELWSYFRVAEHDGKGVDWEGRPVITAQQRDTVSRTHYTPPGYDNVSDLPRNFRRPVAPLGIIRNIVSRFTGLLFSNRKQPRMTVPGDQKTEDYLQAVIQYGGFWPAMIQARNYGGAMGSACVGFRFINGKCTFEALDPRWTTPEFIGRGYTEPVKLTVQYTYSKEVKDDDGKYRAVWYWYRRVIDTETDTVWVPIRCKDKEPNWEYMQRNTVRHGLGFVPYEWIQNLQDDDDCDGDPDCSGCYDLVNVIDQLLAEVYTGTIKNCDPTLMLVTDAEFKDIQKGSDNAIKLNQGGSGSYLELGGNGARVGLEVIKDLEDRVYRLAQCVPDSVLYQNSGEKTATEIERIFSSMLEKADSLREQYGPAMTKICQKVLKAIRLYTQIRELPDGRLIRGRVDVPPKVIQQPDGDTVEIPRNIGKGTICDIKWPPYFRPTMTDADTASRVITSLLTSDPKLITKTTAIKFMAPLMDYDPLVELHALKKEEQDAAMAEQAAGAEGEEGEEAAEETEEDPTTSVASNPAAWKAALDAGIITLNEYREKALGLGAIPDGDLTMVQYRAKYSEVFVANTAATSEKMVDMVNGKFQADQDDKLEARAEKAAQAELAAKEKAEALRAREGQPEAADTSLSFEQPEQPPARRSNAPAAKPSERAVQSPPVPTPTKAED